MTSVEEFAYRLPDRAIAQTPIEPRHDSRLLDTRDLTDHRFLDLPALLEPGDLVVVNQTKVRAARLHAEKRDTGGAVELLLLRRLDRLRWEALVRPARRIRPGVVLVVGPITAVVRTAPEEGRVEVELEAGDRDVDEVLGEVGEMPLPPYVHRRLDRPDRYQTIFARTPGSAAAPTAGLHFTEEVVDGIRRRGIDMTSVDLEVGLATFRPIGADRIEDHRMHEEVFRVGSEAVDAVASCRARGGRVVAIGTTVVRVLETVATVDGGITEGEGSTDLYLVPGAEFSVVDLLVTNFHLPRSSLVVLVAAFMGPGWRAAYDAALDRDYRFLSFGDAMLCAREEQR